MSVRVAAIGVNHWHSLYDLAYLPQLEKMPGVEIIGIHDQDPGIAADRVTHLGGGIPVFTDYADMLSECRPDLVLALDRHDRMGAIVRDLLDRRVPFIVEKPASFNAEELRGLVGRSDARDQFAAVPFLLRYSPFIEHARKILDGGIARSDAALLFTPEPSLVDALPGLGVRVDAGPETFGWRMSPQSG